MHFGADPVLERLVAQANMLAFIPQPIKGEGKMPKKVTLTKGKEFTFKTATSGAFASKYDWDGWFNPDPKHFPSGLVMLERSEGKENDKGTIIEVSEKRDYEVPTDAMPPKIKTAARRRYMVVQVSRVDADGNRLKDALIIKARKMTDEERAAEDLKRAEEKAAKKEGAAEDEDDDTEASANGAAPAPEPVGANG